MFFLTPAVYTVFKFVMSFFPISVWKERNTCAVFICRSLAYKFAGSNSFRSLTMGNAIFWETFWDWKKTYSCQKIQILPLDLRWFSFQDTGTSLHSRRTLNIWKIHAGCQFQCSAGSAFSWGQGKCIFTSSFFTSCPV